MNDLFDRIVAANLFILTSNYEGMPNALIEAMCLGLPVISTKVAGATDLINDGKNGFLINVGDESALVRFMLLLLSEEKLRNEIATNAVKISETLDVSRVTKEWKTFISSVHSKF